MKKEYSLKLKGDAEFLFFFFFFEEGDTES